MKTDLINQARALAVEYLDLWDDHSAALKRSPLQYLDCLMDEIVAAKDVTRPALARLLTRMIPGMLWGTAVRLVRLKFPYAGDTVAIDRKALEHLS